MTLFWHPTGPRIRYEVELLLIEDLNPEAKICWRMSRVEMFQLGWRCIVASLKQGK